MNVLGWIVVGLLAGLVARTVVGDQHRGCLFTVAIGVLGALVGGALMSAVDARGVNDFSLRTIVVAALGAILLLLVVQALEGRARRPPPR